MEIARSRLTQEGGDLGKQVEEHESKLTVLLKGKKTLEQAVEELKRQNEEETRVSDQHLISPYNIRYIIMQIGDDNT